MSARLRRVLVDTPEIGIVTAVIIAFAIFTIKNPSFKSGAELQNLGVDLAGFAILAVGEAFCIITGGIDLSVGSLTAFFVVASAWLNVTAGIPVVLTFVVIILAGALWGLWHGFLITRLGIAPFVATLVTFIFAVGRRRGAGAQPNPRYLDGIPEHHRLDRCWSADCRDRADRDRADRLVRARAHLPGPTDLRRRRQRRGGSPRRHSGEAPDDARLHDQRRLRGSGRDHRRLAPHLRYRRQCFGLGADRDRLVRDRWRQPDRGQGRIIGVLAGAALLVVLRDGLVAINVNVYYQSMVVGVVLLIAIVLDRFRIMRLERSGQRVRQVAEVKGPAAVAASDDRAVG